MDRIPCPMCGEPIAAAAKKCIHCGEWLDPANAPPREDAPAKQGGVSVVLVVAIVAVLGLCLVVPIVAAIAIPNLIEARKHGNEAAAIGGLKTLGSSQSLFREMDREQDNAMDYGSLQELSRTDLIDMVLGSGTKQGYLFQCQASPTTPEFLWMAVANPAVPGTTGDRYFVTNQQGMIFYGTAHPFTITPDCQIPPDARPVGR